MQLIKKCFRYKVYESLESKDMSGGLYRLKEQFFQEQSRWFLWVPVLYALGIGIFFLFKDEPSKWITLAGIESLIVLAIIFRRRLHILFILLLFAIPVLGFASVQIHTLYLATNYHQVTEGTLYLQGRIQSTDYNSRGNQRLILEDMQNFEEQKVLGAYRLSLLPQPDVLHSGQCVELVAKVMPLPASVIPGGLQLDRNLFYKGLSGSGFSLSRVIPIECPSSPNLVDIFSYAVSGLRNAIINHVKKVLPPDEASVASAIIAGEQGGIKRSLIQDYRDSGLAHFLSISGLHMSMLAGLMFFFIRLLVALIPPLALRHDSKKISAVFAIIMSAVYLMISGAAIPAQRAFIMTFIVLLGVLFSRRAISMQTIAWASLLVLFIAPEALVGPSFQMSFAAVVVLIAFYERWAGSLHRFLNGGADRLATNLPIKILKIIFIYFVGILVSDLIASLATLPFAIYHFNRIALYTSLANLLAGPIIGFIIMPFVLLSLLLMPFGLDYWSLKLVGFGISLVNKITAYVSSLPEAGYQVLSMPLWGLLLIVIGVLWLCIWNCRWRRWGGVGVILGVLSISTAQVPDVMVNDEASLLAVKDEQGHLVILPARGNNFIKQVWSDKTATKKLDNKHKQLLKKIYKGQVVDKAWLDFECQEDYCIYKKRFRYEPSLSLKIDGNAFDIKSAGGAIFYLQNDKIEVETVRDYVGHRVWNKID